jgi:cytosine/adenosine deaminase-related metal-dependent hydrolase
VLPGLINAHAHLELSHLHRRVPGGGGFVPWARALVSSPSRPAEADLVAGAASAAFAFGTAWIHDVTSGDSTAEAIRAAGMRGVVHREVLGFDAAALRQRLAALPPAIPFFGGVAERPSPHALLSTPVELVVAAVRAGSDLPPATMHFGETPDERALLERGEGPCAALLDALGRDWRWWCPPGVSAAAHLAAHGLLGPRLILVHAVDVDASDLDLLASSAAPVCLCVRSNLHISGDTPPVEALVQRGVRLAIGTDSLASNDDLDPLAEVVALRSVAPTVPIEVWVGALTHGGADAVGAHGFGRLVTGAAPGVLWLADLDRLDQLDHRPPDDRRWLCPPGLPRS